MKCSNGSASKNVWITEHEQINLRQLTIVLEIHVFWHFWSRPVSPPG